MGRTAHDSARRVREYLETQRPARIGEAEWAAMREALAPVSDSCLRNVIRRTGLPFEQPWCGVRQGSFEELEQSLLEMASAYAEATRQDRRDRARYCRRQVISAKDRARLVARNRRTSPARRAEKLEMVEWMLVWLGDPEMFVAWVDIRKRHMAVTP